MDTNDISIQNQGPNESGESESNINQDAASNDEQTPTNKGLRIGCMTFCIAATVLFLWVWQHQSQFNDNYREALFFMRDGEVEKAIESYQKAIKNKRRTIFFKNEPSAYNNLGHAYMYAGKFTEAVDTFKMVIQKYPDIPEGYINFATVYLQMNEPENAREICLHALQSFPDVPLLHYNLSIAYALTDETTASLNSLKKAITLNPELRDFAKQEGALQDILPILND